MIKILFIKFLFYLVLEQLRQAKNIHILIKYDKLGAVNPPSSHELNLAYSDRYSGEFYIQKFRKSAQFEEKSKIY